VKAIHFVDSALLYARAGNGGDGCVGFRREKRVPRGGPDGGDGGRGGHVILRADRNTDSLIGVWYAPHRRAEHGGYGRGKQQTGRNGRDLLVPVPCGTVVLEADTGRALGDLVADGEQMVAARGGAGGLGNIHWKTSVHRAPRESTGGEPGEERALRLELKVIADLGLVGFPNAGKSSLLAALSDARPKIASYPFTTLHPVLGTMVFDDQSRLKVADIPGLIEGAHRGAGLGHEFLRHIERAPCLALVVDMAGADGRAPWSDYAVLLRELRLHSRDLAERPRLVVANKMDLPEAAQNAARFAAETRTRPVRVSALTGDGVERLRAAIRRLCAGGRRAAGKT
jgi:GTP-binding protein